MIKVNLLDSYIPPGDQSVGPVIGADEMEELKKAAILRLAIIFLPTLLMFMYEMHHIPDLQQQVSKVQATINEAKAYNSKQASAVSEIKKFKEDEKKIQDRIVALEKISKDRINEIKMLHLIQNSIPEKSWLTSLEIEGGQAKLSGIAVNDDEITSFMDSLSKNVMLVEVNLLNAEEISLENQVAKKFEISCAMEKL